MKTKFYTPIVRTLSFDGDFGVYRGSEEVESDNGKYTARFELSISVEAKRTLGSYDTPDETGYINEEITIDELELFNDEGRLELIPEELEKLRVNIMNAVTWET